MPKTKHACTKHTNIKLRFAASHACAAALFKISVGATLGSRLRTAGLRRAMRCMGLTHFRAGAMHCAGLTHATFLKLQGAVTYTYYFKRAVRLPLKHWSKAASSRLASPPAMDCWVVGATHPPPGPVSLHCFPSRVPHPMNGALPWQTHRHSVPVLACASRLESELCTED